ncbi:hypothetical protein [Actinoallomurus acaciae]|uniref:Uncharacterized protein n=1 Tax=Actinoallomurus acaciae TaxID=502577 RepID=A0ABV5YCW4_9ACTN
MAKIVIVHGVGQQVSGHIDLHAKLFPSLRQGITFAGSDIQPSDAVFADYGILYRPKSETLAPAPYYDAADVSDPYELALLEAWWTGAAATDKGVFPPEEEALGRTPGWVQDALYALCESRFFSGIAERFLIGDLKQVKAYFTDPTLRAQIRDRVASYVGDDTRVVIGHSLGSVIAYEILCAHPQWPVTDFVTLGSPLGLRHLVFERLDPPPRSVDSPGQRIGRWPGSVTRWTNIVDEGDIVCLVENLRPLFGERVGHIRLHNGVHAHDMRPYLTDLLTGTTIARALDGSV